MHVSSVTLLNAVVVLSTFIPWTSATVCFSQYNWMNNFMFQNPCTVAGFLNSQCAEDPSKSVVWPVPVNHTTYPVPGDPNAFPVSPCVCNTVYYNMIQACSKCQGLFIGPWSDWQRNCPTKNTTMFLKTIPARTMIPLWAYQDVLKTNFFNPATALLVSGKKVPNALLLSPKGRIAMIVLSSIGGLFALVSATFSCWRICKRRQRSGVPSDSESPDTDGDDGEDKEQQQGLLDAGAPMGTTETAEVDKVPYTDTSFAPQLNDKNGESSSGYSPSVDHQGQGTYQPGLYWNTAQE